MEYEDVIDCANGGHYGQGSENYVSVSYDAHPNDDKQN